MTTLPTTADLNSASVTQGVFRTAIGNLRNVVAELPGGQSEGSFPISSGTITPTVGFFSIDVEGGVASSDDLDYINPTNMPSGRFIVIRCAAASRAIVVKHNRPSTGRIITLDGLDAVLNSRTRWMLLAHNAGSGQWEEVMRSWTSAGAFGGQLVSSATEADARALLNVAQRTDAEKYVIATGTNAIAVVLSPAVTAFTDGMPIAFRAANTITGACTLAVNALAAKAIQHSDGSALAAGDIVAGMVVEVRYQASAGAFRIVSPTGSFVRRAGDTMTGNLLLPGAIVRANGTGYGASGFQLSSGTDISGLFAAASLASVAYTACNSTVYTDTGDGVFAPKVTGVFVNEWTATQIYLAATRNSNCAPGTCGGA